MKLITAFFRLIRWPNLVFIVITQCLFYLIVFRETAPGYAFDQYTFTFILLVIASACISAAGYIINDYFDRQIDVVNKPNRVVIDVYIKRRWAIVWHWLLSGIGLVLSIYISLQQHSILIAAGNALCIFLLYIYSISLKKRLLIGNLLIAALTAWVIIVIYFFAGSGIALFSKEIQTFDDNKFFKLTGLYAGFAFIVSLIREIVKDMEDVQGDRMHGCTTMPIQWGIPASKVFAGVWTMVCMFLLAISFIYAYKSSWWYVVAYIPIFLIFPFIHFASYLIKAQNAAHFHYLSNVMKGIMLFGILSMLLFLL